MIREFLGNLKNRWIGFRFRPRPAFIGGRELKLLDGTVRHTADSDDAWFAALVRGKQVIFDVGANIGFSGVLASLYGRPRNLLLIDPNPLALATAASNLILNDLAENCRFVAAFVGEKANEKVKFYTVGRGAAGSKYPDHAKSASATNSWYWVKTTSIDELSAVYGLDPDFVKIDVEGAESDVLKGAIRLASKRQAIFFVEMHSNKDLTMKVNADKILSWCEAVGYKAWYMKEALLLESSDQIAHRGRCHLLLQPGNIGYPEAIASILQGAQLPNLELY